MGPWRVDGELDLGPILERFWHFWVYPCKNLSINLAMSALLLMSITEFPKVSAMAVL